MRWSRITLEAVCIDGSRRAPDAPRYTVDLPLISDGRIAMHELAANQQRAVVARELPEGGVVAGALEVKDKQCIFTWGTGPANALPPRRLYPLRGFGALIVNAVALELAPQYLHRIGLDVVAITQTSRRQNIAEVAARFLAMQQQPAPPVAKC